MPTYTTQREALVALADLLSVIGSASGLEAVMRGEVADAGLPRQAGTIQTLAMTARGHLLVSEGAPSVWRDRPNPWGTPLCWRQE